MTMSVVILLFFAVVTFGATLDVRIFMLLFEFLQDHSFFGVHVSIGFRFFHRAQSRLDLASLHFFERVWEFDMEKNEKISKLVWIFVEWKTFIFDSHERVWFDHLAWFALDSE